MNFMFRNYSLLKTVKFLFSNNPNLIYVGSILKDYKSLIFANLSNFNASIIKHMDSLF